MSNSAPKEVRAGKQSSLFLSFGFKLMLIMTLLVTGVSVTTVLVIERQINRSYRELLERQFSEEVKRFRDSQVTRTETIREGIITAAGAVRPTAAMTSGDPDRIYTDLNYELEPLLESYALGESGPEKSTFFLFFNPEGKLVRNPRSKAQKQDIYAAKFEPMVQMATKEKNSISGYLVIKENNLPLLYEVIITPIEDDFSGDKLGYVLFALPAQLGSKSGQIINRSIVSKFYVDGYFLPESLSKSWRVKLKPFLDQTGTRKSATPEIRLGEQTYLLFTHNISPGGSFPVAVQLSLYSLEELESLLDYLNVLLLALLPASLIVAMALSTLASRRVAKRVLMLAKGTEAIRKGDLKVRMEPMGRDEIGFLGDSFNRMAADLELKEKYRNVLDLVSDRSVAQKLISGAIELGGELRQATILFCDIRGFTPLTDGMDPQEVVSLVNAHMTAMTQVAHQWNGVIDKFVGDEIMVLFGVPQAGEADIVNAVRCGLDMIAERSRLNQTVERPIQIGIGIATGEVVAGYMGSEKRLNYSVLGDRVNLAARLCSKAAAGEVIIDERTVAALPEGSKFDRIDSVALKGFNDQVSVYRIQSIP